MDFIFWVCIVILFFLGLEIISRIRGNIRYYLYEKEQMKKKFIFELGQKLIALVPQLKNRKIEKVSIQTLVEQFHFNEKEAFLSMYSILVDEHTNSPFIPMVIVPHIDENEKVVNYEIEIQDKLESTMLTKIINGDIADITVDGKSLLVSTKLGARINLKIK